MSNAVLSPEVSDVLARSAISGNRLTLPQQLDRKTYEAVDKALKNAGGKWNRGAKAHVFDGDAAAKVAEMIKSGVSVDVKSLRQAFYTPEAVASLLVDYADVGAMEVLEPSAGGGALADACMKAGAAEVICIEIDEGEAEKLRAREYKVFNVDFLTVTPRAFERIVMNPPFTKGQDLAHLKHACRFLAYGGVLVCVLPGSRPGAKVQEFLDGLDYELIELPEGAFKESGTNVRTCAVVIQG